MNFIKIKVNDNKFSHTFTRLVAYLKACYPDFCNWDFEYNDNGFHKYRVLFEHLVLEFITNDYATFVQHDYDPQFVNASHIKVEWLKNYTAPDDPDELAIYIDLKTNYNKDICIGASNVFGEGFIMIKENN